MRERERERYGRRVCLSVYTHVMCGGSGSHTVTGSRTWVLLQTACWIKHPAVIPHSDEESVKTVRQHTKCAVCNINNSTNK